MVCFSYWRLRFYTPLVGGSNPSSPTILYWCLVDFEAVVFPFLPTTGVRRFSNLSERRGQTMPGKALSRFNKRDLSGIELKITGGKGTAQGSIRQNTTRR